MTIMPSTLQTTRVTTSPTPRGVARTQQRSASFLGCRASGTRPAASHTSLMATPRTAHIPKGSQRFAGRAVHLPLPSSHCSGRPACQSRVHSVTASSDAPVFPDHKIAVFSTKPYVRESFQALVEQSFPNAVFYEPSLSKDTVNLTSGVEIVVLFVNDVADAEVIAGLAENGVKHIAMRCAGFDKVDLDAAATAGITVSRVPSYSPVSIAEHAVALLMTLNRKLHRVANRIREGNFTLSGLQGYEIHGKTVGVIGTGRIGKSFCNIMRRGFGCRVLAYDMFPADDMKEMGVEYMELDEMLPQCDAVCIFCPLTESTHHLLNEDSINTMKEGAFLINVSRGGLVDTDALLKGLKSGRIGAAGLDVYESEASLFFNDFSTSGRFDSSGWDGRFAELEVLPNVLISPHTAFLTYEALENITKTVVENLVEYASGKPLTNEIKGTKTASVVSSISDDLHATATK